MIRNYFVIFVLITVSTFAQPSETVIHYPATLENIDSQKNYFIQILNEACKEITAEFGQCELKPITLPMFQARQLKSLESGLLDVVWTVSTPNREQTFLAIKIPLMDGLLGFRIAIFNESVAGAFTVNTNLDSIKPLRLVQGHDWPDVSVLVASGFNVITTSFQHSTYRDISKGVYDYTLRGIFESTVEFEKSTITLNNLLLEQNHLFVYPSYIYFFLKKDNFELAKKLTFAVSNLKKKGKLNEIMLSYPAHRHALSTLQLIKRKQHLIPKNGVSLDHITVSKKLDKLYEK